MSVTGFPDEDGGQPLKTGVAVADLITGLYAATAIGAALTARERDGRGRYLDLALFDCLTAALANQATNYLVSGDAPQRLGNRHPNIAPYEAFPASDAFFIIAVGNDGQFGRLLKVLELDDLARDSRFSTNESRVRHHAVLSSVISEKTKTKRVEDWISLLKQADVPCGRIRSVEDVFDHPQAKARKALRGGAVCPWGCRIIPGITFALRGGFVFASGAACFRPAYRGHSPERNWP